MFINHVKAGRPTLTQKTFTLNPNLLNFVLGRVGFAGYVPIWDGGSASCHVKLRVYNYMGQPEHNPFSNSVKADRPALTQNMFILNPNPLYFVLGSWVMSKIATPSLSQVWSGLSSAWKAHHAPYPNPWAVKLVWQYFNIKKHTIFINYMYTERERERENYMILLYS